MTKIIHNWFPPRKARDAGTSNVYNAGIAHLGRSGPGSEAACGNRRAHQTFGKEDFRNDPNKCKRCAEKLNKWDQMKAKREAREATSDMVRKPSFGERVYRKGDPVHVGKVLNTRVLGLGNQEAKVQWEDNKWIEYVNLNDLEPALEWVPGHGHVKM